MELIITNRKGEKFVILHDECDAEFINKHTWHVSKTPNGYYVSTSIRQKDGSYKKYLLHRLLLNAPRECVVDHRNHNPLDNHRHNIRLCTYSQNLQNITPRGKSKYLGVSLNIDKRSCPPLVKWQSSIRINGIKKNLGCFKDEQDAAKAYDKAAIVYHGEFANLNFKTG